MADSSQQNIDQQDADSGGEESACTDPPLSAEPLANRIQAFVEPEVEGEAHEDLHEGVPLESADEEDSPQETGDPQVEEESPEGSGEPPASEPERMSLVSDADASFVNRRVVAKVYGDDRRLEDRRWAVGGSVRRCHCCEQAIDPSSEFYATLTAAQIPDDDNRLAEVSALFDRYDYCCRCYEEGKAEHAFAYWKSVMDAPQREPRKIVNLSALLVYFQHLVALEVQEPTTAEENDGDLESEGDFESQERARERASILAALPKIDGRDAELMRYLLALFLIRKRVLKWIQAEKGTLRVREVKSKVEHDVSEPQISEADLKDAIEAFEELFR